MDKDRRFAVLIDADNVSDKYIRLILDELSNDGTITYKRIYGDWTRPALGSWKSVLLDYSISPIQQYGYTTGKNATDSAMIIDAMDILYTGNVEGFCIVSSDSDFTRLASRLREAGKFVIGMGEKKTPKPFIVACDKFVYIESLKAAEKAQPPAPAGKSTKKKAVPSESPALSVQELIAQSVEDLADEDGYAYLGDLGTLLIKKQPDFDARNYGFAKLSRFIAALDGFELDERHNPKYQGTQVFVRNKK